jgi:6-phosphogluconolactonase
MPESDIRVLDDLARGVAGFFAERLSTAAGQKGVASFVLAGGGTPLALYRALASPPYRQAIPWEKVHFFWGDERLVRPDDPGSNYAAARNAFLDPLSIPPDNIHRIKGELQPQEAAADYAARLSAWAVKYDPGASNLWPRFDLVLLGLGEDGHTASLFPGSPVEVDSPVMAVTADYKGRPAGRVTLTPPVFNDARAVCFLVSGTNKAEAVYQTLSSDDPVQLPAQRIRPANGQVTWLLDRAAAAALDAY